MDTRHENREGKDAFDYITENLCTTIQNKGDGFDITRNKVIKT